MFKEYGICVHIPTQSATGIFFPLILEHRYPNILVCDPQKAGDPLLASWEPVCFTLYVTEDSENVRKNQLNLIWVNHPLDMYWLQSHMGLNVVANERIPSYKMTCFITQPHYLRVLFSSLKLLMENEQVSG